ncbi:MAG: hypothetical protein AAGI69_16160 [Cyanobacteria bacterium P01_H01_bin.21]
MATFGARISAQLHQLVMLTTTDIHLGNQQREKLSPHKKSKQNLFLTYWIPGVDWSLKQVTESHNR